VYAFLGAINRWLGGTRATLARFGEFCSAWRPGERIEVLDVAAGNGDFARALIGWGRAHGFDVRVTALDISQAALRSRTMRQADRAEPRLRFLCGDVRHLPCHDHSVDYVTSALFFHHLTDIEAVQALQRFERLARRGIVVNDLVRRWRLHAWTWLLTRPCNPVLRNDGPLSVRRAFRPRELEALAREAGLGWLTTREHFGHRMTLAGERPRSA
jgi:SAM-dependent methyltransferase